MKQLFIYLALILFCACHLNKSTYPDITDSDCQTFCISSDDTVLIRIFDWAKDNSDKYVGDDNDPVGPWYEAALPDRDAFCIRDVSHQCIGEELNGHGRQNANMMRQFVENISESKDYCTYWEINKYNLPAPADYVSDQDFWYNLNANFDIIYACYRLYLWTGNRMYIEDSRFEKFFSLSMNEYIDRWQLQVDRIMHRSGVMNEDESYENSKFKIYRGLPSYEESVGDLSVTGDLIAAIYRGMKSYARILEIKGQNDVAMRYDNWATAYAQLYDSVWWNDVSKNYYAYKLKTGQMEEGGCNIFSLWFGIINSRERLNRLLEALIEKETNVENMSYYPVILYRNGLNEDGYRSIHKLFENERKDYPEVASGVIEGVVCGLAGVDADAIANRVTTLPRMTDSTHWISIENIPIFSGKISVLHKSMNSSVFVNKSDMEVIWRPMFFGHAVYINNVKAKHTTDILGNQYSYIDLVCSPRMAMTAEMHIQ